MGFAITYKTVLEVNLWQHFLLDTASDNFTLPPSPATPAGVVQRILQYGLTTASFHAGRGDFDRATQMVDELAAQLTAPLNRFADFGYLTILPLDLLSTSMSGLSSKLGEEVREKRGLVYYCGAFQLSGVDPGMYIMYAGTREKDLPELTRLFKEEVKRVTTDGISQGELDQARNRLIAAHRMSLQDNFQLAMMCGLNELTGLGYNYGFSMEERLKSFTVESVRKVAAEYLSPEKMISSATLPEKE